MNQNKQTDEKKTVDTSDDNPKFGRLLLVLLFAVAVIVLITFATEAYHSK